MNKDNLSRKKLQKIKDTKIEDSHPYTARLVEIIKKYRVSGNKLDHFYWGIGFLLCGKVSNKKNEKNSIKVSIKRDITPFILITLVAYIAIGTAV